MRRSKHGLMGGGIAVPAMAAALSLTGGAALAQTDAPVRTAPAEATVPEDPREAKIEQLEAQIQDLAAEVQDLKASTSNNIRAVRADEAKAEASAPKVSFPSGRPTISSPDGAFKVALRTDVQFDAAHYDVSPWTTANNLSSGTDFRRARLGIDATVFKDWNVAIWGEFGGRGTESPALNQAYLEYAGWKTKAFEARLRIGAWATPVNLEDATSNTESLFPERAAVEEVERGLAGGDGRSSVGAFFNGTSWYVSGVLTGDVVGAPSAAEYGEQEGYIVSEWGVSENNRKAKFYKLTRAGRKKLEKEERLWKQATTIMHRFLSPAKESS